jgi:hypothetical protein
VYKYNWRRYLALRPILIEGTRRRPRWWRLSIGSVLTLGIGFVVFRRLKRGFYNHFECHGGDSFPAGFEDIPPHTGPADPSFFAIGSGAPRNMIFTR